MPALTKLSSRRMKERKVTIPSSAGIRLEGLLTVHEASSFSGGVILCHPHPQYGGDMYNPVIAAGAEAASQEGYSTLCFNFRGVGESEGSYGEGIGEQADVQAAIECLDSELRNPDSFIILFGYSFGAWTALPIAVQDQRVKGMIAVAPPLEMYDFGFLQGCKKRKLFIAGSQDVYCPASVLRKWYERLDEPKSLMIIPGADHFFFSHTHALAQPVKEFLRTFL